MEIVRGEGEPWAAMITCTAFDSGIVWVFSTCN
jgi:hypothetical protein